MELLMIGHLLGDFYFQTDNISEQKRVSLKYLLLHAVLYMTAVYCAVIFATGVAGEYLRSMIILGALHMAIDWIKKKIEKKFKTQEKYKLTILEIDQLIHIWILWTFFSHGLGKTDFKWFSESFVNQISEYWIVGIAALLCGKPAAIVVALVFERIPKTLQKADEQVNQTESLKIGSWVGILEREIILILGLLGQFGAIGFVLAAKSLARHSQLNNQAFAEKYLVGTLLSSFIALSNVAMCLCLKGMR